MDYVFKLTREDRDCGLFRTMLGAKSKVDSWLETDSEWVCYAPDIYWMFHYSANATFRIQRLEVQD